MKSPQELEFDITKELQGLESAIDSGAFARILAVILDFFGLVRNNKDFPQNIDMLIDAALTEITAATTSTGGVSYWAQLLRNAVFAEEMKTLDAISSTTKALSELLLRTAHYGLLRGYSGESARGEWTRLQRGVLAAVFAQRAATRASSSAVQTPRSSLAAGSNI